MTESRTYKNENSLKNYLAKTFSTVALGVAISALLAYVASQFIPILLLRTPGLYLGLSIVAIVGELGIAFYFSSNLTRMSKQTAWICYILYSVITGLSFSTIVMTYTDATITLAFVSTAIMFVCMSIIGHTSNIDYTRVYSLFLPAIIAGFIMTLLNAFLIHSAWINMVIVYIGLVLFLVITAADVQRLRQFYFASQTDDELSEKLMIMGAFQLYLDFANLFIKILQIFGRRNRD